MSVCTSPSVCLSVHTYREQYPAGHQVFPSYPGHIHCVVSVCTSPSVCLSVHTYREQYPAVHQVFPSYPSHIHCVVSVCTSPSVCLSVHTYREQYPAGHQVFPSYSGHTRCAHADGDERESSGSVGSGVSTVQQLEHPEQVVSGGGTL